MSSPDAIAEVFEQLKRGFEENRLAHAYLIIGSPQGNAWELSSALLRLIFTDAREGFDIKAHPDVYCVEPESKSRKIVIDDIRGLNKRMSQTSFSGGWKIGIILYADRMNDAAANAFLKTLEEPPGKSMLLLLTDHPERLLPTIISRCQRISLPSGQGADMGPWLDQVMSLLREGVPRDGLTAISHGARLKTLLDDVKASLAKESDVEEEGEEIDKDVREARIAAKTSAVQAEIVKLILLWQRDVLVANLQGAAELLEFPEEQKYIAEQAASLTYAEALANVQRIESVARQLDRNLKIDVAYEGSTIRFMVPSG